MASIPSSAQSVDDSDLSYISYSGSWTTYNNCTLDYQETLHSTTQNGASATFTFTGFNAVGALLDIPACSGSVIGSWTVNGQTGKVLVPCTSSDQANYPFYPYTAVSSFGPTTIVVRNAAGSAPFQLDRFIVGNITNNTPSPLSNTPTATDPSTTASSVFTTVLTSSSPGTSSSQSTSLSSNSTVAASVATALNAGASSVSTFRGTAGVSSSGVISPQNTSVSNSTPSSPSSLPLGPIIGGVLGALSLLLLFVFFLLRYRPWQREKNNREETEPSSTLTPFSVQEMTVGQLSPDDKTAFMATILSRSSSLVATPGQPSQIRPHSDIDDNPTISQEKGPLNPASPPTLIPENRASLAPSYSPNPDRRYLQSGFSASVSMDVPPAYDNIRPGISQA